MFVYSTSPYESHCIYMEDDSQQDSNKTEPMQEKHTFE